MEHQYKMTPEEIQNSIIQGFDMAVQAGPLCLEQMMGVIYIVEDINVVEDAPFAALAGGDEEPPKKEGEHDGCSGEINTGPHFHDDEGQQPQQEEESKEGSVSDTASQINFHHFFSSHTHTCILALLTYLSSHSLACFAA